MRYEEDKLKNDFEKPKFTPYDNMPTERERGGCLSTFLVFVIGVNIFFMFALCAQAGNLGRMADSALPILALAFGIQGAILACAFAVWNWKKWGFYGLMVAYGIQIVLQLLSGNMIGVIAALVGMGILFTLVNDKLDMFE